MNRKIVKKIILTLLIIISYTIQGQDIITNTVYGFSIKQTILPGGTTDEYIYNEGTLTVNKITLKWNDDKLKESKSVALSVKIKDAQKLILDSIINDININTLDSLYSNPVIDGVYWIFNFKINNEVIKVQLDNYYLEQLDKLLIFINKILPTENRYITFNTLGVKDDCETK